MRTKDTLLQVIGQQVRTRRLALNLTQEGLGKKADIVGKYVSEIERGTRDIPISTLQAIVEHGLGLRLDVTFAQRNGSRPDLRMPPLPPDVEDAARLIAEI